MPSYKFISLHFISLLCDNLDECQQGKKKVIGETVKFTNLSHAFMNIAVKEISSAKKNN